jgi:transcriptional regulator with PAS, ATPase and Fis domain
VHLARDIAGSAMPETPSQPETEVLCLMGSTVLIASRAMHEVLRLTRKAARSDAAVLITGETGVGKELVARAVHDGSLRRARPWVDVNCAALPDHLIESELFGYEKGAFSGAGTCKPGLFELAHSGSLFLDEIGELDPRAQVKLLRVLDGAPYYRLGGTRKVIVDTRVIAATNANLEAAVRRGAFRSDLYYRLGQLQITVPPLRERRDEIELLARFFLERACADLRLSPSAVMLLRDHDWPGNVRELRNCMIRAAAMAEDGVIDLRHLGPVGVPVAGVQAARQGTIEGLERELIHSTVAQTGGNQQRAAELLGISRRTLYRKLRAYEQETVGIS